MNRPLRHDALLVWRETAAALAGWGDRALVVIGVALIAVSVRHAAEGAAVVPLKAIALLIGLWTGFAFGCAVERRLAFHAAEYCYAADILTGGGAWQYRGGAIAAMLAVIVAAAAAVDLRAGFPAAGGCLVGVAAAIGWDRRAAGRAEYRASRRGAPLAIGTAAAIVLATSRWWWPAAPVWSAATLIGVVLAMMAPDDAEAIRFDAVVGRNVGATLVRLRSAALWLVGLTLVARFVRGLSAALIGASIGIIVIWLAVLRVLAWRFSGRRSGELIVLAAVAVSALIGAMALPLAPIALAAATVWLWRRADAVRWMIA